MKLVINSCYGGFSISLAAARWMAERGHTTAQANVNQYDKGNDKQKRWYSGHDYERNDPLLIQAVEVLGDAANGECAKLKVVEIPDGIKWGIDEYDGIEHVEEQHQTWS